MPRKIKSNPFCSTLHIHATALTNDKDLKIVWKKLPPDMGAGYDYKTNTIFMPAVNVPLLTELEKIKLMALSYHERKHHALSECSLFEKALKENTDWDPKTNPNAQPNELLKNLLNCLEDARIEMSKHYFLPGDFEDLMTFRKEICRDDENYKMPLWEKIQRQNPYGAMMMSYIFSIAGYFELPIIDELKELREIGWKILNDGRFHKAVEMRREGTQICYEIAQDIILAWGNPPKESSGQGKGEGGLGQGNGKGKRIKWEDLTDEQKEAILEMIKKFNEDQEKNGGEFSINPDSLNDEMAELSRGNADSEMGDIPNSSMNDIDHSDAYVPYDPYDRTVIAKKYPVSYNEFKASINTKITHAKNTLTKVLIALSRDEKNNCLRHGHIDRRRLSKVITGSDRIFYKKTDGINIKSAVQLVIDLSGSMSGPRAQLAAQVATLFGETLNTLNVPFEIIGFNTNSMDSSEERKADNEGYNRTGDIINRWIFKEFNENFNTVKERLGSCGHSMDESSHKKNCGAIGGCNIDHEVILWGASRLWSENVDRKIQIVLSDGLPSGYQHTYGGLLPRMLKETNEKIERNGIEQFCFGINCEEVKHYYSKYKIINNLEEMNMEALNFLADSLKRKFIR